MPLFSSSHEFRKEVVKHCQRDAQSIVRAVAEGLSYFKDSRHRQEIFLMASRSSELSMLSSPLHLETYHEVDLSLQRLDAD